MEPVMRRLAVALYLLPLLLTVSGALAIAVKGESSRFVAVASGIEYVSFQVRPGDAEPFSGHAFKIDLDVAELRLVSAGGPSSRRTEEIVASYPAVVATNASFFDKDGRAMGLGVDEGRLIASGKRQSWGALVVTDKRARIVLGAEVNAPLAHRLVAGHPTSRRRRKGPAAEAATR